MKEHKVKKVVYVISGINYSLGFDWLDQYLDRTRFEPVFIFLNQTEPSLVHLLQKRGTTVIYFHLGSKKDYPTILLKLIQLFLKIRPDIVHAHLFDANLLAMSAAFLTGVKRRVYTRHHSTYHHDYHPSMVKYDRLVNSLSTHIASISENVTSIMVSREKVNPSKIFLVHHGFELKKFQEVDRVKVDALRSKYKVESHFPVIGVISRFTSWKGIQFIIPAFKQLLVKYPDAVLLLANASGDYESEIDKLLEGIPSHSYRKIAFETDLFSFYQLFDIFVHVPVDEYAEAYGQIYVEALASGIPSVFTLSGVAREFIVNEENALVVPFKDAIAILNAMERILKDDKIRERISLNGPHAVRGRFEVTNMMNTLYKLYEA
ncbi:MAG: glycosyltransferase [Bacteroidia bacterium]|jgi:glycosyltransferase involved in cell wall biosynthesis|nr:glycosyltransferase [Bacteroidia bacterium]